MKRVVVTGMGIVSSIGNNTQEVTAALREARSGVVKADDYARLGFRCQVHGAPHIDLDTAVDRRVRRFMGDGAAWNYVAMKQAIQDAGLEEREVKSERTGLIMGSGGPSTRTIVAAADTQRRDGRLGAAGDHHVDVAALDDPRGVADGVRAGRAGRHLAVVRPL